MLNQIFSSTAVSFIAFAVTVLGVYLLREKWKKLTLLFLSITISVCIGELYLRLFYPQFNEHDKMFERDSELGWRFISNKRGSIAYTGEVHHFIETNSFGFRDRPRALLSGESSKKIMVIGDSFVSNISVGENEVFTADMEKHLTNTEVLNLGINGYNNVQELLLLKKWLPRINPDLIILVIYIRNDFMENTGQDWIAYPRPFASIQGSDARVVLYPPSNIQPATATPLKTRFYEKSHVYQAIHQSLFLAAINLSALLHLGDTQSALASYTFPELYLCRIQSSSRMEEMYELMGKLILEFSEYAQKRKVPLVFALAPSMWQVDDKLWCTFSDSLGGDKSGYSRSLPNDRLMKFAKLNDLRMIDLLPPLRAGNNNGLKIYNGMEQHWTKEGNRIVAEVLLEYLKTHSLIK